MEYKNYYCNDVIDRKACPLIYNEGKNSYKIGKHTMPSLEEIVGSLTGEYAKQIEEKRFLLNRLHSFLLTGKKDVAASFLDTPAPYAKSLKKHIDKWGRYKEETNAQTIEIMKYKKTNSVKNDAKNTFPYYLDLLEDELDKHVENPHHYEQIANIEKHLLENIVSENRFAIALTEGKVEDKDNRIIDRDKIAWYSEIEHINRLHYHVAKKRSVRENIYFVSHIDLITNNTLYYVSTTVDFSFMYVCLPNHFLIVPQFYRSINIPECSR